MEHRRDFGHRVGVEISRLHALLRRLLGPKLALPPPDWGLIHCRRCAKDTTNPIRWHEHDDAHWWIRLRCGECGASRDVIVPDHEAQRLDCDLERGVAQIAAELAMLERMNMRAEVTALTEALERDLIAPDDFVR
jgi:hypothetical protein